ncbi:MAG: double-strand break repair protein AddB [Acidobacteria bacterium]|nr:double-strand break repair protein AddB [Acidobacteriota bacterium]
MITPRTTRLLRVPDLHAFRQAAVDLACTGTPFEARNRLVVVPTRAAAAYLLRSIESRLLTADAALVLPDLITPGELAARLGERLPQHPLLLTDIEREVLAGVACRTAIEKGSAPPFRLRAGLIAEIVRFYDALQRHLKSVDTFERLALGALEPGAAEDRGAERLVRQTRFLADTFRHFERLIETTGRMDDHALRVRLVGEPASDPWRHVVLAVGDDASDRHGLSPADWDLLTRVPGLERIDIVATDAVVAGAFHERIHQLLPGLEETRVPIDHPRSPPVLLVPPGGALTHTARDREEEVAGFARWVRREMRSTDAGAISRVDRMALVVRRPLPYVYLAREVLRSAGIPSQMFDALPLASEPYAAALDLVIGFVRGNCGRGPAIALLRSPHFRFGPDDAPLTPREVVALDRALSDAGYLGGIDALERLVATWREAKSGSRPPQPAKALRAAAATLEAAGQLTPLWSAAPCAEQLDGLLAFLRRHERFPRPDDPLRSRHLRGRAAVLDALMSLRDAYARFDPLAVDFDAVASSVKRWIDAHTFAPRTGDAGVHLVDAESARFGDFEGVQLAGLIDGEWPDTPRRNIFYPPALLRELGWPAESDRIDGARASFSDLLRLPSSRLVVSTFTLEDDAIVAASTLVDALPAAGLDTSEDVIPAARIFEYEALGLDPVETRHLGPVACATAARRIGAVRVRRPGATDGHDMPAYSLSALERYQDCPFKFFAADVLRLEEPPEDEPMLSPRARGRFVHEVFQRFFEAWDARGNRTITVDLVDEARALFLEVAGPMLARFSEAEALLERSRLFGTAVSIGIVDVVLGLEASRPAPVRERWLEYRLEGAFSLGVPGGRRIPVKGVADRIDLLEGDRLRVIDYKSGYPPNPKRALQAPIYALCAQERLAERDGRHWHIDEAAYVAFAGKRPLVPVVKPGAADADAVLAGARTRVMDIVDGIGRGEFPPRPYDPRICGYCAYPSVCRKDYVGDD